MQNSSEAPKVLQTDAETLSEHVFRRIQAAIVCGEIAPGSKISEPELARSYGISRGTLREAIHRLEGQRLLVRVPHVGARVVQLSHAELIELYEIRESLEGMACRLAAARMSLEDIGELRRVLDTHERDVAFQAGVGYYQQEGDFDFHYRIIQGSGNRTLSQLLCGDLYQLVRMYRIQFSTMPNRPRQAFNEHHRILDAIAERDGELAELLMRRHIGASKRNIEQHYHEEHHEQQHQQHNEQPSEQRYSEQQNKQRPQEAAQANGKLSRAWQAASTQPVQPVQSVQSVKPRGES